MFKILKYLLAMSFYKKAKKQLILLTMLLLSLWVSSSVINDLIGASSGMNLYALIALKWIVMLALLSFIVLKILKIMHLLIPNPLSKEKRAKKSKNITPKKAYIMNKETLLTESEMILQKYSKATK